MQLETTCKLPNGQVETAVHMNDKKAAFPRGLKCTDCRYSSCTVQRLMQSVKFHAITSHNKIASKGYVVIQQHVTVWLD